MTRKKAAPLGQVDMLPIQHRSLQTNRLRKYGPKDSRYVNAERVFAAEWKRQNRLKYYNGWPLLSWIIGKTGPVPISQRDAEVVASVVQWLGTNVGMGFLSTCERKIAELHEKGAIAREEAKLSAQIAAYRRERFDGLRAERWRDASRRLKVAMQEIDAEFESYRRIDLSDD